MKVGDRVLVCVEVCGLAEDGRIGVRSSTKEVLVVSRDEVFDAYKLVPPAWVHLEEAARLLDGLGEPASASVAREHAKRLKPRVKTPAETLLDEPWMRRATLRLPPGHPQVALPRALVEEAINELVAYVKQRYAGMAGYPTMEVRMKRDLDVVRRLRQAMERH